VAWGIAARIRAWEGKVGVEIKKKMYAP